MGTEQEPLGQSLHSEGPAGGPIGDGRSNRLPLPITVIGCICEALEASKDIHTLLQVQRISHDGWSAATPRIWKNLRLRSDEAWDLFLTPWESAESIQRLQNELASTPSGFHLSHMVTNAPNQSSSTADTGVFSDAQKRFMIAFNSVETVRIDFKPHMRLGEVFEAVLRALERDGRPVAPRRIATLHFPGDLAFRLPDRLDSQVAVPGSRDVMFLVGAMLLPKEIIVHSKVGRRLMRAFEAVSSAIHERGLEVKIRVHTSVFQWLDPYDFWRCPKVVVFVGTSDAVGVVHGLRQFERLLHRLHPSIKESEHNAVEFVLLDRTEAACQDMMDDIVDSAHMPQGAGSPPGVDVISKDRVEIVGGRHRLKYVKLRSGMGLPPCDICPEYEAQDESRVTRIRRVVARLTGADDTHGGDHGGSF